jgi:hypothetical protein
MLNRLFLGFAIIGRIKARAFKKQAAARRDQSGGNSAAPGAFKDGWVIGYSQHLLETEPAVPTSIFIGWHD